MELALGLKITKTRDDIASISKYQLAKDKGPVFQSRETNTMFILSAYLKGYKRNDININISKDGSKISISGKKPIQEMLMMGWVMHRKEVEITGFNRVFKIPNGVNLDKIKAKHDEEEWTLNIFMPKLVKGICGVRIEEVKEEEPEERGKSAQEKSETDNVCSSVGETSQKGPKEFDVSESFMEKEGVSDKNKMLDDANGEINRETKQNEVESSKLGIEDGNGESLREKVGKEEHQVMKTSEQEKKVDVYVPQKLEDTSQDAESKVQKLKESENVEKKEGEVSDKMLDDANGEINRETKQKEVESSKLGIEDGNGESLREKVGKEEHEGMKSSEQEKNVDDYVTQKLEITSQDEESEVQKLKEGENVEKKEGGVFGKMLDDTKEDITGDRSQKEIEETVLRIGDAKVKGIRQRDREAAFEAMKRSEIEQDVGVGTPQKIGDKEANIGGMKESESFVEKKEKKAYDDILDDANGNINEEKQRGETKSTVEKMETEETRMILKANSHTEEDTYGESKQKESGEPKCEAEDRINERMKESSVERSEEIKTSELGETVCDHIPSSIVGVSLEEKFKESRIQQMEKTETIEGKMDGGLSEKMPFESNKETQKTIFGDTIQKDIKRPKMTTEGGGQECVREKVVKEGFDGVIDLCEEFPKQLPNGTHEESEGMDVTNLQEAKKVKEELVKRKGKVIEYFVEKGEGEGPKEMPMGAEIEQDVKKVQGEKYEKVQVEADSGLRKYITSEKTHERTEEPKILIKEKNQQSLQEDMRKGRYEALTTEIKFPMQIVDSLAKKREASKDKELEEAEDVKGDVVKRMSGETEVVESTTKEKIQESESGRISMTLQETPEEKYPKALDIRTPERDLQSEKVVGKGLKEVEEGRAKEKRQKTDLPPPKIQSKETHESKTENVNQGILKPKKSKEEGERQQYSYDKEITTEVASVEDQAAKPSSASWFPSTQQSQVDEKDKLNEGSKGKYKASPELQKEGSTKEIQNLIEMKENQESKQTETLKPKNPLGMHYDKGGQVITKDEFHKGQKDREAMREETEEPKIKIDDRDQQYVAVDSGEVVSKVLTIENEMPKKEYLADIARAIAEPERMETKRGLKEGLENKVENVTDEKPTIQEQNRKADTEMVDKAKCTPESMKITQEKESPIKSEAPEKEAESLEAMYSLPSIESVGVEDAVLKNGIEQLQQKELSPLTAEMKSKEPQKLEKPIIEWKFPEIIGHVPFPEWREREQYGYSSEDTKAENIAAYQEDLLKQDHGEETVLEKRKGSKFAKSEEAKEASRQSLGIERGKATQTAEEKKPKIKEITPEFEKASAFKQVAEKLHETGKREDQRESDEVSSKMGVEPPTKMEITQNKEVESKEPRELSRPSIEDAIPMIEEAQQEKEDERLIDALELEATVSKEEGLAHATKRHSNAKRNVEPNVDIDKPKEPIQSTEGSTASEVVAEKEEERLIHALEQVATISKEEGLAQATNRHSNAKSNVEPKVDINKPKESIESTEGTTALEVVADKVAQPSKYSSSSSTQQQFEVEEKDKKDANHEVGNPGSPETKDSKLDFQESTKSKTDQEVDQIENLQPQSPADEQFINKDQETKHGTHEIEEDKAYEQRDEICGEDFQLLEEQKECKEEARGGKKDTKWSKKLFVPLVIAGTAIFVSLVVVFIRHRRARKR